MKRGRAVFIALAAALFASVAPAFGDAPFTLAHSPGGFAFWYLQRSDAHETVLLGGFNDGWVLAHPDRSATPVVGAALSRYGPKSLPAGDFNEELKDVRAHCGLLAGPMYSTFSLEAHPAEFGEALDLCFGILSEPALRASDLEKIRKGSEAGHLRMMERPEAIAGLLMRRATLGDAPFARWEEPEAIAAVTPADVDAWRSAVFARDNLTIVVVGSLDVDAAAAMIDKTFVRLPEHAAPAPTAPPAINFSGRTILLEKPGEQTAILLEGGLDLVLGEGPVALVGVNVLGGGLDRRLSKAVRGELGATYGISAGLGQFTPTQRYIAIRSALANDLAPAALARVREVYATWRRDGVTEEENSSAREQLASGFDKNSETSSGRAYGLLALLRGGASAAYEANYTDNLRRIDSDRVNLLLRDKAPERLTTVIVAPSASGFNADCVIHSIDEAATCK